MSLMALCLAGLLLVLPALWFLRKTSREVPRSAAHSVARTLTLGFLMLLVVGFGLCGALGVGYGVLMLGAGKEVVAFALLFGVPGVAGLVLAHTLYRQTQRARRPDAPDYEAPEP